MRIVSLLPSATEIICALGFKNSLVGRSHECDYPQGLEQLPVCCEPKFDPSKGSSRKIDKTVKEIVEKSLSVYNVDSQRLKALRPDVIVTQAQCEVCAVSMKDIQQCLCDWLDETPQVVSLEPNTLSDVWQGIRDVAQTLGSAGKAEEIIQGYQSSMNAVAGKAQSLHLKPTVACIEWLDPLMAAGNWIPELLEMLGAVNLFGEAGKHSPWMTFEELKEKDPDIIVTMPCGWGIKRCREEMPVLMNQEAWRSLSAVKNKRVYLTDGHHFFNRPGPRLVESLEILAEILYPEQMDFGHKDTFWELL